MVTEEQPKTVSRTPTDSELDEFKELAYRIDFLNDRIDRVRTRDAGRRPASHEERFQLLKDRFELDRLLTEAEFFMARFG